MSPTLCYNTLLSMQPQNSICLYAEKSSLSREVLLGRGRAHANASTCMACRTPMQLLEAGMTHTPQRRRSRRPMARPSSTGEQSMALRRQLPLLLLAMAGRARLRPARGAAPPSPRSRGRATGHAPAAIPTSPGGTVSGIATAQLLVMVLRCLLALSGSPANDLGHPDHLWRVQPCVVKECPLRSNTLHAMRLHCRGTCNRCKAAKPGGGGGAGAGRGSGGRGRGRDSAGPPGGGRGPTAAAPQGPPGQ